MLSLGLVGNWVGLWKHGGFAIGGDRCADLAKRCGSLSRVLALLRSEMGHWLEGNRLGLRLHHVGVGSVVGPAVAGHLTNRWSGRVRDKVPSADVSVRASQLNR